MKAQSDANTLVILCDLCISEVEAGHCPGTHFTIVGWESLVANFIWKRVY